MFPTRIGAWASSFLFRFDEHIAHFQQLSSNESVLEFILELISFDSTRARPGSAKLLSTVWLLLNQSFGEV